LQHVYAYLAQKRWFRLTNPLRSLPARFAVLASGSPRTSPV
jgi:hypothetical protein